MEPLTRAPHENCTEIKSYIDLTVCFLVIGTTVLFIHAVGLCAVPSVKLYTYL